MQCGLYRKQKEWQQLWGSASFNQGLVYVHYILILFHHMYAIHVEVHVHEYPHATPHARLHLPPNSHSTLLRSARAGGGSATLVGKPADCGGLKTLRSERSRPENLGMYTLFSSRFSGCWVCSPFRIRASSYPSYVKNGRPRAIMSKL